jgi:DNA-binding NtrC family response regulator
MFPRQIVVLGGENEPDFLDMLRREGWGVLPVRSATQLSTINRNADSTACGLLLAGSQFRQQLPRFRSMLLSTDFEWVVLLDQQMLEVAEVRQFVDECCYDYHHRPLDAKRLLVTLGRLRGKALLRNRQYDVEAPIGELIGGHPTMVQLRKNAQRIARSHANVLITGESGTGKELVARTIHRLSDRSDGVFQAVNCGALPGSLVQSELFGYEKGAFTGASERRLGRIEAASGGTLLLDEIGDMALEAQANLLRFLQEGTIERLGSPQPIGVNVRVVAATHVNLMNQVKQGGFREDLYYRLTVCTIHIPPLRERPSDIIPIAQHLIARHAENLGVPKRRLSTESVQALVNHGWPGNVRELTNRLSQGLVMSSGRFIKPKDMGLEPGEEALVYPLGKERENAEREALRVALAINQGNRSKVARSLGVSRATLYRLLNKHQLLDIADVAT